VHLMKTYPANQPKPKFYITCGTEDDLLPGSRRLYRDLSDNGFSAEIEEWPGIHDWDFWDASIRKGMEKMK